MSKQKPSDICKPCTCMRILLFSVDTLFAPIPHFTIYFFLCEESSIQPRLDCLKTLRYIVSLCPYACMTVLLPPPPLQMKLTVGGISAECLIFSVPRRKKADCHHS